MKKTEIISKINDAITELAGMIDMYNKRSKDPQNFMDYQTCVDAQEAIKAFENIYDDKTEWLSSDGEPIKIGDELDILSINMYGGLVNLKEGVICLETAFFNKPIEQHIKDPNIEFCIIRKEIVNSSDDILPF